MPFRYLIAITFVLAVKTAWAQTFKVLHYTETSGFDHQTRQSSLQMFQSLGTANNFTVDDDSDGAAFNSLSNLQQYAVVIFSNTSGDAILDPTQRANFEAYMNAGGSFLGIHAASDTYRHSTANGPNTGAWDWYAELLGASVQQNPNHVNGTPAYNISKIGSHASTANLPDPWLKNEEYYYWEDGYYNSANVPVLEVEQTVGPNGQVNSYDAARPMSWYKVLPSGGRLFYTALGHAASNFVSDQNFSNHLRDALLWLADKTNGAQQLELENQLVIQISGTSLTMQLKAPNNVTATIRLYNPAGQIIHQSTEQLNPAGFTKTIELDTLTNGLYLLQIQGENLSITRKVLLGTSK